MNPRLRRRRFGSGRMVARRRLCDASGMSGSETIEGADDVVDALLALPPQEFTEARNEAAKQLRAEGNRAAADAVKGLPRPPISLWALNRLARDDAAPIDAFLDAASRLFEAHRNGGDIRAATPPEREAEARVVAAASELVRAQGAKVSDAVTSRLRETLRAAAGDAEIATCAAGGAAHTRADGALPGGDPRRAAARTAGSGKRKARPASAPEGKRQALREKLEASRKEAADVRREARAATDSAEEARAHGSARRISQSASSARPRRRRSACGNSRVNSTRSDEKGSARPHARSPVWSARLRGTRRGWRAAPIQ